MSDVREASSDFNLVHVVDFQTKPEGSDHPDRPRTDEEEHRELDPVLRPTGHIGSQYAECSTRCTECWSPRIGVDEGPGDVAAEQTDDVDRHPSAGSHPLLQRDAGKGDDDDVAEDMDPTGVKPGGGDESVSLSRFAGKSRNQTEEGSRFEVEQALFEEHLVEGDQQQRENGGERETGLLFRSHDIGGCGDCQKEGDCEVVAGRQVGP